MLIARTLANAHRNDTRALLVLLVTKTKILSGISEDPYLNPLLNDK